MKKINEQMVRKSTVNQLKNIQSKIQKEGGDISSKLKSDYSRQNKTNNSIKIQNPIKSKIQTIDDMMEIGEKYTVKKFEQFSQEDFDRTSVAGIEPNVDFESEKDMVVKKALDSESIMMALTGKKDATIEEIQDAIEDLDPEDIENLIVTESVDVEKGVIDINREIKTIANWQNTYNDGVGGNPNANCVRKVNAGRQVDLGNGEVGYVEGVCGNDVIVQTLDGSGHKIMKFSDITKNYKKEKVEEVKKEVETEEKSEQTVDSKKIGDEIYKEKEIKIMDFDKYIKK